MNNDFMPRTILFKTHSGKAWLTVFLAIIQSLFFIISAFLLEKTSHSYSEFTFEG